LIFGYARVSKNDQTLSLQKDALQRAGCDEVFSDEASGAKANRLGLSALLSHTRKGDTIVVWKLDRIGRNIGNLIELAKALEDKGVHFQSLTEKINTDSPAGRFFFHMMASLAQMERDLIVERTKAGLEAAKARGRVGGRRRKMTASKIDAARKLLDSGVPPRDVASNLGVSIPTLYRWLPASSVGDNP
jgi:DNA invertase Pin-like site-specific DNA recombinase